MASWWRWRKVRSEQTPPSNAPTAGDLVQLLASLTESSIARFKAQLDNDAKIEELNLKKRELELTHAESIAKANAIEREARAELREKKKQWWRENGTQQRRNSRSQQQGQTGCRVCENPHNPDLSAPEIFAHHQHTN